MPKRLLLLSAVAFALVYWGAGAKCLAEQVDVSAQFEQADEYEEDGKYKDAEVIYKGIAEAYAGKEDGLRAQQKLVCLYIERGRTAEAETAYQGLLAGYAGYGDDNVIADAVDDVADAYRDVKKYDKALEIYSYVVDTWPGSKQAVGSHGGIARVNIALGREESAQAAIDKLFEGFSDNEDIANAVRDVANEYREVKKYEKALGFYKQVVDSWPESEEAMDSQEDVAKLYIELGDDPNAEAAVDKLIADFAGRDEIADAVDDVADEYLEVKKYEKALELYKYVVDSWPESEQALGSQGCIVRINIELGDDPNWDAAVDKLIADFAGRDETADAVHDAANGYRDVKKYEKALELYKYVVDSWPERKQTIWSQAAIAKLYIELGDDPNAKVAVDKLIADFSANSDLPAALNLVGEIYEKAGKFEEAKSVYQQVLQQNPDRRLAQKVERAILKVDVLPVMRSGDDANIVEAIDKLIADFNDHPGLAKAVFEIAKKYHDMGQLTFNEACEYERGPNQPGKARAREYFRRALAVAERIIIEELTESDGDATVEAYNLAAECCHRLGKFENAIDYYQEVVDRCPECKYAWRAQFLVGHSYKRLRNLRAIDKAKGEALIRDAYEKVLENYPSCPAARAARMWLNSHTQTNEGEEK